MRTREIIETLRPRLRGCLIATDFDGTLAPLVLDPQQSRPVDGAVEALREAAERGAQIAVITGRDVRTVVRLGDLDRIPSVVVAGMYGIETLHDGVLETPPTPENLERLRDQLPQVIGGADRQVWIEDKRLSMVVHTRRASDPAAQVRQLSPALQRLADELELELHRGSDVLELRLPGYDKAGALARLAEGHDAVLFLGDDLGDVPAFEQIKRLRESGVSAFSVAVRSSGVAELDGAADVDVEDPEAVVRLLTALVSESDPHSPAGS